MAKLSKYYHVTRQIMIEYVSNQYEPNTQVDTVSATYKVYTGFDDNVYYTEAPRSQTNKYNNSQYFIKFPDESGSGYTYLGLQKEDDDTYGNNFLSDEISKYVKAISNEQNKAMYYDKIRIHFVYGFLLDKLAGYSLQVKTTAKYLGPVQCHHDNSLTHMKFDDRGNPIFETETVTYINDDDKEVTEVMERLVTNTKDFILLDYFFPKECLNFDNLVKYHKVPIYQNECFYDRYIEVDVPSAYYLSLDGGTVPLVVPNNYGYAGERIEVDGKFYAHPAGITDQRYITYNILPDPQLIIGFATVSQENSKDATIEPLVTGGVYGTSYPRTYARTFFLDPINEIAINYGSNSDFFNVRIFEDTENNEIVYYPVFGERELDAEIFNNIEQGSIPLITEGFYDGLDNIETFAELYGSDAYKWIIYNDITVTYNYGSFTRSLDDPDMISSSTTQHFTNIIDYGQHNQETEGAFWKNSFIPRVPTRNNSYATSILISYTCRLVNRLNGVEAIRNATLSVSNPEKYVARRVAINNVTTYKIVNQIKRQNIGHRTIQKESNDKLIRCYYDATNIVVKDMSTNSLYTQGQMTLHLQHTSSNYLFRLFTLNDDNVRIPFDLTGPYRYKLVFPTNKGEKITIRPNTENTDLNLGIGQLVFFISEEFVKQIMAVPVQERYFAIMTDVEKAEQMQSTLYEGKVSYYV